ncbi:hypothetical protein [Tolypothrix sp. VBCCA 56010]|uniref:hypothetical protein n=1 Tax=Tolypothrix sp. VBCCA 56010 TaxID=3137731 RepID=UPI003D7DC1B3
MPDQYESRRITINCFAVQEICRLEGIAHDAPSNVISAAIEKFIFKVASGNAAPPQPPASSPPTVNKTGLAAMVSQARTAT